MKSVQKLLVSVRHFHGIIFAVQILDAHEITTKFRDPAGNVIGLYQQPNGLTSALLYIFVEHFRFGWIISLNLLIIELQI
ncbi:MAG TPA: hypothetical protein VF884_15290 [Nitrososphaeraceae archaeon]